MPFLALFVEETFVTAEIISADSKLQRTWYLPKENLKLGLQSFWREYLSTKSSAPMSKTASGETTTGATIGGEALNSGPEKIFIIDRFTKKILRYRLGGSVALITLPGLGKFHELTLQGSSGDSRYLPETKPALSSEDLRFEVLELDKVVSEIVPKMKLMGCKRIVCHHPQLTANHELIRELRALEFEVSTVTFPANLQVLRESILSLSVQGTLSDLSDEMMAAFPQQPLEILWLGSRGFQKLSETNGNAEASTTNSAINSAANSTANSTAKSTTLKNGGTSGGTSSGTYGDAHGDSRSDAHGDSRNNAHGGTHGDAHVGTHSDAKDSGIPTMNSSDLIAATSSQDSRFSFLNHWPQPKTSTLFIGWDQCYLIRTDSRKNARPTVAIPLSTGLGSTFEFESSYYNWANNQCLDPGPLAFGRSQKLMAIDLFAEEFLKQGFLSELINQEKFENKLQSIWKVFQKFHPKGTLGQIKEEWLGQLLVEACSHLQNEDLVLSGTALHLVLPTLKKSSYKKLAGVHADSKWSMSDWIHP